MGSHIKDWSWTGRFEIREGHLTDKVNLRLGLIHRLKNDREVSAKYHYSESEQSDGSTENSTVLSLGTAWHPSEKDFVLFSRLDLVDKQSKSMANNNDTHTQKVIHNVHLNRKLNQKTQVSLHHGVKHIIDQNKAAKQTSTIDTGSIALRRDLSKRWDIGVKAGYLHDWSSGATETVAGLSLGVTPLKNAWLELGYNIDGFNDEDFDNSNYKRKGAYLSFRYKFNQDSLKKNKRK